MNAQARLSPGGTQKTASLVMVLGHPGEAFSSEIVCAGLHSVRLLLFTYRHRARNVGPFLGAKTSARTTGDCGHGPRGYKQEVTGSKPVSRTT